MCQSNDCAMCITSKDVDHHPGIGVWWMPLNEDNFSIFPLHSLSLLRLELHSIQSLCIPGICIIIHWYSIFLFVLSLLLLFPKCYILNKEIWVFIIEEWQSKPRPAFNSCINIEICRFYSSDKIMQFLCIGKLQSSRYVKAAHTWREWTNPLTFIVMWRAKHVGTLKGWVPFEPWYPWSKHLFKKWCLKSKSVDLQDTISSSKCHWREKRGDASKLGPRNSHRADYTAVVFSDSHTQISVLVENSSRISILWKTHHLKISCGTRYPSVLVGMTHIYNFIFNLKFLN